jgi:16S rRNA (cytidine1402-2'-O)-methyltransferase
MNEHSGKPPAEPLAASLYVVATPIGHLADLSARARDTLLHVRWVAAEDTRVAKGLLHAIGSTAQVFALHQHNEPEAARRVLDLLGQGHSVALVSDAGTPAISDPGVEVVRAAQQAGHTIQPIPGASAVTTLLSVAGVRASGFMFDGFLPAKAKARQERCRALLAACQANGHALVLFEAPHRIAELLGDLALMLNDQQRVVIGRELTKRFEQIVVLQASALPAWVQADSNHARGELVIAIEPMPDAADDSQRAAFDPQASVPIQAQALLHALAKEMSTSQAAKLGATLLGAERAEVYRWLTEQRAERGSLDEDRS